ncbi:RNA polymerase subunit sigma-70 [Nocardia stercoris]|uniref:Sigma-70 family RNA polymerase sigma factor n=1 Tax=Nocardia stercoris TaxID=2483361 RepID=A0A3M2L9Q2_9NOCA|nr:RNA polymerase subunit sigma-70 [Nocardia stercoris]RMI33440.1 sigma-70 family RNA polymerase sigma factor [Nocardia stercoris]
MTVADDIAVAADSHRHELLAYCYRMTGSLHDAEDLVQETTVRAWRAAASYDPHRASVRTWLYRIATNLCLTALQHAERRVLPTDMSEPTGIWQVGVHPRRPEIPWLQPFPDSEPGDPAGTVAARDTIRLAFVSALQHLSPNQRAVLVLRDVLMFRAAETAELLELTPAAVNSALLRARARLAEIGPAAADSELSDTEQRHFLDRYVKAFEALDVETLKSVLRDDVVMQMPPFAAWFEGVDAVSAFLAEVFGASAEFRLLSTRANGQPAFGAYRPESTGSCAVNLHIPTLTADGISRIDIFHAPELFPAFGLPVRLP